MVAPTSRGCAVDLQEGAEKARQESDRATSRCGGISGGDGDGGTVVRTHRALPRRHLFPKLLSSSSRASHRSRGHGQSQADECSSRRSSQGARPLESRRQGLVWSTGRPATSQRRRVGRMYAVRSLHSNNNQIRWYVTPPIAQVSWRRAGGDRGGQNDVLHSRFAPLAE